MTDNSQMVINLTEEIMEAVSPIINVVETGIVVSALINITITTVMLGLSSDQPRAMRLIAAIFDGQAVQV